MTVDEHFFFRNSWTIDPPVANSENVQHDPPLSEHMAANTSGDVDNRFARYIRQQHFIIAVAVTASRAGWCLDIDVHFIMTVILIALFALLC